VDEFYQVLGLDDKPTLMDETSSLYIIDEILENNIWQYLRPRSDNSKYFKDIKSLISLLKKESLSPERFLGLINNDIYYAVTSPLLSYDIGTYIVTISNEINVNPITDTFSSIELDPKKDLFDLGYNRGTLNIQYNFLKSLCNSKPNQRYWIKEISTSRREIKLSSQDISDIDIKNGFSYYNSYINSKVGFHDFYLNFGKNQLIIAINLAYVEDINGSYLVVKLYEPLPFDFDLKSTLWIVDKVSEPVKFNVSIFTEEYVVIKKDYIRGPNFKIEIKKQQGQTTPYYNYTQLFSSEYSSSMKQLQSYYQDKSVAINVDF
jgi:hypothetical protein